jgi:hypothetical protein
LQPKGAQEAYLKLERLLDNLERCQHHVVNLDVLQYVAVLFLEMLPFAFNLKRPNIFPLSIFSSLV